MDWGFAHHTAIGWYTRGEVEEDGEKRLVIIKYREMVTSKTTAELLGERIAEASNGEKISAFFLSPDAFAQKESIRTIAVQLSESLRRQGLPGAAPADNDRVGGWNLMYQQFETDRYLIFDSCVETIKAIPTLMRNPEKLEDVLKTESLADDVGDCDRYAIKSYMSPRKEPEELEWQRRYDKATEMGKAVLLWRRDSERERKHQPIRPRLMVKSSIQ